MNIIGLFEKLQIDKSTLRVLSSEAIIRIEKQINLEKKLNADIDTNTASNLISALKNHKEALYFIIQNRVLYNFFAGTNFSRHKFSPDNESISEHKISEFITHYLEDDLILKSDKILSENRFDDLSELLMAKKYFPEDVLLKINKRIIGKMDFALSELTRNPNVDKTAIQYISSRSFYNALSHFSSVETDEKVRKILNIVVNIYNANNASLFASSTMWSMSNYEAFDEYLNSVILKNSAIVSSPPERESSSSMPIGRIIFIILIIIKFVVLASKCSGSNNSGSNNYNVDTFQNLNQYRESAAAINEQRIFSFQEFLAGYDQKSMKNIVKVDTLKTGQNPFYMNNNIIGQSSTPDSIWITNNTKYDLVVMEQKNRGDINVPMNAYYIKAKDKFKVDFHRKTYNFYFGKQLASFDTDDQQYQYTDINSKKKLRFSKLIDNSRGIVSKEFTLKNDLTISLKKKVLTLHSIGLSCENDMPDKGIVDAYTFGETHSVETEIIKESN